APSRSWQQPNRRPDEHVGRSGARPPLGSAHGYPLSPPGALDRPSAPPTRPARNDFGQVVGEPETGGAPRGVQGDRRFRVRVRAPRVIRPVSRSPSRRDRAPPAGQAARTHAPATRTLLS